jgi:hypothetical protein
MRWRDACSKVRSDEVQDGKLRSQAATGPCGYTSLEQEPPSAFDLPFWRARSASKGDQQPFTPLAFMRLEVVSIAGGARRASALRDHTDLPLSRA